MRFWDASALVPLCVDQPESSRVKTLLDSDGVMAVWWGSVVECWSAFARLRREGLFSIDDEDAARELLQTLQDSWIEICLLYTSPSPRDGLLSRMPSSA